MASITGLRPVPKNAGHIDSDFDAGVSGARERGQPRKSQEGDSCSLNGFPGTIRRGKDGKLHCVPNDPNQRGANYSPPLDAKTTDAAQIARSHQKNMDAIYSELAQDLSNQWRGQS